MKTYTFEAEIKKIAGKDATYVEIPLMLKGVCSKKS